MTKFRVSTAGGDTLDVESDDMSLGEILDELKAQGYAFGAKASSNGEPVDGDHVPEEGEVIATHDTPGGN